MHAAIGMALQERRDRRFLAERHQQLDLGIRQRDENGGDAMRRQIDRRRYLGAGTPRSDIQSLAAGRLASCGMGWRTGLNPAGMRKASTKSPSASTPAT